jgi:purine-nucleoside phosphorylase
MTLKETINSMQSLYDKVQESAGFVRSLYPQIPKYGVILGTGLGGFEDQLENRVEIDYKDIPHFPVSSVPGHKGKLYLGTVAGKQTVCMSGRMHYYEGYSMQEVTFPTRMLAALGIHTLIVSNASGGVNPNLSAGDLVFIKDHINMMTNNPLRGRYDDRWGPQFPDMLDAYDPKVLQLMESICIELDVPFKTGVYLALDGPNLETASEYTFANHIGADMVGMSTVPEVIVARQMDLRISGVSLVTNECFPPERIQKTSVEDVVEVASSSAPVIQAVLHNFIKMS